MTTVAAHPVPSRTASDPVLSLRDLHVTFSGGVQAVRGVTLDVSPGEAQRPWGRQHTMARASGGCGPIGAPPA